MINEGHEPDLDPLQSSHNHDSPGPQCPRSATLLFRTYSLFSSSIVSEWLANRCNLGRRKKKQKPNWGHCSFLSITLVAPLWASYIAYIVCEMPATRFPSRTTLSSSSIIHRTPRTRIVRTDLCCRPVASIWLAVFVCGGEIPPRSSCCTGLAGKYHGQTETTIKDEKIK